MIEAEASNNPMMYLEGIRRTRGEVVKPLHKKLTHVDPIPEYLRAEDRKVMASWLRDWNHIYQ